MGSGNTPSNITSGAAAAAAGVAGCPDELTVPATASQHPVEIGARGDVVILDGALVLLGSAGSIAELHSNNLRLCVEMGRRYEGVLVNGGRGLVARCTSLD